MPFLEEILKCKSVSVVGLEKNTGKTECLNYIIKRIKTYPVQVALTSIGIDGEQLDQVTKTHKPEIEVFENMIFTTSENYYNQRKIVSEILAVSNRQTALGRLVTAKAKNSGKLLLAGPSTTTWMQTLIKELRALLVDTVLVDGALSRLSLASPAVTEGMILCTGAAVSANIPQLVKKTAFVYKLICLDEIESSRLKSSLEVIEQGIWAVGNEGDLLDLHVPSVFSLSHNKENLFRHGTTIFVSGAISDAFLNMLRIQKEIKETVLIIRDFTKVFVSEEAFLAFTKKGGKIKVLQKTKLISICVNPTAPNGVVLPSPELCNEIQKAVQLPVYDVRKLPKG